MKQPPGFFGYKNADEFFKDQFDKVAAPVNWFYIGQLLKHSADVIFGEFEKGWQAFLAAKNEPQTFEQLKQWRVYMFLSGLALENILKGICVARDKKIIQDGKFKKGVHLLNNLVNHINDLSLPSDQISLTQEEGLLLEELTRVIRWAGRYPIPKQYQDTIPRGFLGAKTGRSQSLGPHSKELIDKLFERLTDMLKREFKNV